MAYMITTTWHRSWEIAGVISPRTTLEYHLARCALLPTGSEIKPIPIFVRARCRIALFRQEEQKNEYGKTENYRIHGFSLLSHRILVRESGISEFRAASVRMCPGDPRRSRSGMDTRPGNGRCDNLVCTVGVYLNFIGELAVTWT